MHELAILAIVRGNILRHSRIQLAFELMRLSGKENDTLHQKVYLLISIYKYFGSYCYKTIK
jgi:hypothetical protein